MGLFESSEKFEGVLSGFFRLVADTPSIADKLLASNSSFGSLTKTLTLYY
jgi:hypothetical protein